MLKKGIFVFGVHGKFCADMLHVLFFFKGLT